MSDQSWYELPTQEEVHRYLKERAMLKADIETLANALQIAQAQVSQRKPRDTAARIIGIDEASSQQLLSLQNKIAELRGSLALADAEIEFHNYKREIYKALAYRERF